MKKSKFIVLIFILLPFSAYAHGPVTTLTRTTDNNIVEFEYGTLGNITAGDFTLFDTYLLDKDQNPQDFDSAFIKITKPNGSNVFSSILPESSDTKGSSKFGTTMPTAGNYVATVQFTKNGQVIGPQTFNFDVIGSNTATQGGKSNIFVIVSAGVLGLIIGMIISRILHKKNV